MHIGHRRAGWPGLLVAGLAFLLPAVVIVGVLAWAYVDVRRRGRRSSAVLAGVAPGRRRASSPTPAWSIGRTALRTPSAGRARPWPRSSAALAGVPEIASCSGSARSRPPGRRSAGSPRRGRPAGAAPRCCPAGLVRRRRSVRRRRCSWRPSVGRRRRWRSSSSSSRSAPSLFGSGYVLVALLQAELVERLGWITEAQLIDAIAVGQATPGPLFSTATFIGYLVGGPVGAVAATVGIFLPGVRRGRHQHPAARRGCAARPRAGPSSTASTPRPSGCSPSSAFRSRSRSIDDVLDRRPSPSWRSCCCWRGVGTGLAHRGRGRRRPRPGWRSLQLTVVPGDRRRSAVLARLPASWRVRTRRLPHPTRRLRIVKPNSEPPVGRRRAQIRPPIASRGWRRRTARCPIRPRSGRCRDRDRTARTVGRSIACGDARPVVEHADRDVVALVVALDLDRRARRRVLGRVAEQVAHDLLDIGRPRPATIGRSGSHRQLHGRWSAAPRPRWPTMRSSSRRSSRGSASMSSRPRSTRLRTSRSSTRRCSRSDLGADVLSSAVARRRRPSPRSGRVRIWAEPEDRRDRRPQLVADDVDEGLPELGGAPLVREQLVALLLDASPLGDVLSGAEHPDGAPSASRKTRPAPCVQWTLPSGQTMRNSRLERDRSRRPRPRSRSRNGCPVVGMDPFEVGHRRRVVARCGSIPCWRKIASDHVSSPVSMSHSQKPVPDAASISSSRASRASTASDRVAASSSASARRSRDGAPRADEHDQCRRR